MARTCALVIAALAVTAVQAAGISESTGANPMRRVITMLQSIQKKVEAEASRDSDLHDKYMCYCKTGAGTLATSIANAEAKLGNVGSEVKEAQAQKQQTEQELEGHKADRSDAQGAVASATSVREKEAAVFAAFKSNADSNIDALNRAVAALSKGMAGAFLQTSSAQVLRQLVQSTESLRDEDRQDVLAFLAAGQGAEYAPQSGQITGILKELADEMGAGLSEATATEKTAINNFESLMGAKNKEIAQATSAIEKKSVRVGELGVSIAEMLGDLSDTSKSFEDDKAFLAGLDKNCKTKEAEYSEIVKTRSEELVALADTVKMLNDDDALELFKKTLPSAAASFAQVKVASDITRMRALAVINAAQIKHKSTELDFIALALHGRKAGFEKVIKMVDEMVANLKKEQTSDDDKKEYCSISFDAADDKRKGLERTISDAGAAISDAEERLSSLVSEIKAVQDGIKALDASVAEATAQRKAEHSEFSELMAQNSAAVELIGVAKNRLNKFYNPKLHVAAPKRELSREDRIAVNMGGTMAPTPAPGGIAGTGVTVLAQVVAHGVSKEAPPPAPEAVGAYSKSEDSNGVIAMMDLLVKDLEKEMTVASTEEKDGQADYEQAMSDSAQKRKDDSQTLADRESAKADTEGALQGHKDDEASASSEHAATLQYINGLHAECDWLVQYFDVRKEARASEIDALGKAKAVLSGSDFSLLETRSLRGAYFGM